MTGNPETDAETGATAPDAGGFRSGYVALIGRPNAGKSTLLNRLVGMKLAATTHKPQTSRRNVLGILHRPDAQVLFLDTPGYHQAKGPLNQLMVAQAKSAIDEADLIAFMVEARSDGAITPGNRAVIDALRVRETPLIGIVNKVDALADKNQLLPFLQALSQALPQAVAWVPISARRGQGVADLVDRIVGALPEGPPLYDEDTVTDQSERQIGAELIREKLILVTQQELPYVTAVEVESFEDDRPRLVRIEATIHVERASQKAIVIGRGGERLKEIGRRARIELERMLDAKVYLGLYVRVTERWSTKPGQVERLVLGDAALDGAGGGTRA